MFLDIANGKRVSLKSMNGTMFSVYVLFLYNGFVAMIALYFPPWDTHFSLNVLQKPYAMIMMMWVVYPRIQPRLNR